MNDFAVSRTHVNDGQGSVRGHGLIRTIQDTHAGIYGPEGWEGSNPSEGPRSEDPIPSGRRRPPLSSGLPAGALAVEGSFTSIARLNAPGSQR
jgi:hypothetical protein